MKFLFQSVDSPVDSEENRGLIGTEFRTEKQAGFGIHHRILYIMPFPGLPGGVRPLLESQ
jgi:hypothetical protein